MPTPGFLAGTLDDNGYPAWITNLDNDDNTNRTVQVVRGLAPADALHVAGARPGVITPCRLPGQRPGNRTSLPRAAIGPTDSGAVLLAGQNGPWTFIYDDAEMTCGVQDDRGARGLVPPAKMLSAAGREAATSTDGITLNTSLLREAGVVYADEAHPRVRDACIRAVACTEFRTAHTDGRSAEGIDAGGVLLGYEGVIAGDRYAPGTGA